ncbi:MAG: DUF624 domain-containing protein [Lachnospiraceae bacterium]|nr:DUF624 domain-containing protein [Lachnospiraceae bacterium]
MKFFSTEGGLYKFMTSLFSVFKINMLWLICSLPIVTMGAATIAAYDVLLKMVDDQEGYVGRQFWKAFKANLKMGIPLGLLNIACVYIVWLDFSLFEGLPGNPIFLLIMGIVATIVFIASFLYVYPLLARYDNTLFRSLENSATIARRYYGRTVLLVVVVAIELIMILWNSTTLFIGALIGPACIMYTISGMAKSIFRMIEKEPGAVSNPEQLEGEDRR